MASSLYRLLAVRIGNGYEVAKSRHLFRDFIDAMAEVSITEGEAVVRYQKRAHNPLLIAAGRDQVVSTAAIEDLAVRLRAGSHLIIAGARHELMMEQDRYRAQFWAAFDAFVPGTPLFK